MLVPWNWRKKVRDGEAHALPGVLVHRFRLRSGENFLEARIVSQRVPLPAQTQVGERNVPWIRIFNPIAFSLALAVSAILLGAPQVNAQCSELISGLRAPLGTALTNQGNLLVSETGTGAPGTGRISIAFHCHKQKKPINR